MQYCCHCGEKLSLEIPEMDNRLRYVCHSCHSIHYENPKLVVGAIVVKDDKVLLCRRAIEPQYGLWTLPAGYMENDETTLEGAQRETMEEAGAEFCHARLYRLFDIPWINQVYLFYLAELKDQQMQAGAESLEVKLFAEHEVPWQDLAFPAVIDSLKDYFRDAKTGQFPIKTGLPSHRLSELL